MRDERALALKVIRNDLATAPFIRDRATFDAISWDDPAAPTPQLARLTPQEACNVFGARPSQCDIVVVILWSRLGTHLDLEKFPRPDGTPWLSGTEWEFEDALGETPPPDILVYRRTEEPTISIKDPERDDKIHQYELVEQFFQRFLNPDGSVSGGVTYYGTPSGFADRLLKDLVRLVEQKLRERTTEKNVVPARVAPAEPRWHSSPYPGLLPFQMEQADIFFGRGRELDDLVRMLRDPGRRFLAVVGASGTGKSSLIRAGLLPRLRDIDEAEYGPFLIITPGSLGPDPFLALASELVRQLPPDRRQRPRDIANTLSASSRAIANEYASPGGLLFVDQMEELFTQVAAVWREPFAALLAAAARSATWRVIITLRSDFVDSLLRLLPFRWLMTLDTYLLSLPGPAAMVDMICRPAELAGASVDEGLPDEILKDAGDEPGSLPLIGFCLRVLHDRNPASLSMDAYHDAGRLRGIITRHADGVLRALNEQFGKRAVEETLVSIFQALVHVTSTGTPTRRRCVLDRFEPGSTARLVVERLTDERLLTGGSEGSSVEVAHETLFEAWSTLRDWIERNRADLELRDELAIDTYRWHAAGCDDDFLLPGGKRLKRAIELIETRFDLCEPDVNAFIAASAKRVQQQEQRDRDDWRRETQRLADLADQCVRAGDAITGVLLALEALPSPKRPERPLFPEPLSALYSALAIRREVIVLAGHEDEVLLARFSPDGTRIATASRDSSARLWEARSGRLIAVLRGHTDKVFSVAFSPRAELLVTASGDGTARVWNAWTGALAGILGGHAGSVNVAAFSPDGSRIVTASDDGSARLWVAATLQMSALLGAHDGWVNAAVFSPDGTSLATASADKTAKIWDVETGEQIAQLIGHDGWVLFASFSPDGTCLLTTSEDKTVRLWDAASGQAIAVATGHEGYVLPVAFSSSGAHFVTSSYDGTARLWRTTSAECLQVFRGHEGALYSVALSPKEKLAATSSADGTVRLWNSMGQCSAILAGHEGPVWSVSFSPDGRHLVTSSSDRTGRIWRTTSSGAPIVLRGHCGRISTVVFSPGGSHVLTASTDCSAWLWDAVSGEPVVSFRGHDDYVNAAAFSTDAERAITASADGTARVWDTRSGEMTLILRGHQNWVNCASFSPNDDLILTASSDRTACLWNGSTGDVTAVLEGHASWVIGAAFSPDGAKIVTGSRDSEVRLWDAGSGRTLRVLADHRDQVTSVTFSPCGRRVLSGSFDCTARLWDATTGEPLAVLEGHGGPVWSAMFSPDGTHVLTASSDGQARTWDAHNGECVATLRGHDRRVRCAMFRADGAQIVTASDDRTARLWDTATGEPLAVLRSHERSLTCAVFSPGGDRIATASEDTTAILWHSFRSAADLIAEGLRVIPRRLTASQRARFFLRPVE